MLSIKVTDFFELLKKNKNCENSIEYFDIANTCTVNHHNFIVCRGRAIAFDLIRHLAKYTYDGYKCLSDLLNNTRMISNLSSS